MLLSDVIYAYSPLESDSLKVPVTRLPVPATARGLEGVSVSAQGDEGAPVSATTESGIYLRTSFDDWYNRIHVVPAALALGNIAGAVQRTVRVWNAFFVPAVLEDFSLTPGQGLSYTSSVELPVSLPPLEDVTYDINVSADGPPIISGEAVWTIDGVGYVVPITGQRSVLFGFRPDWKMSRVNETYEWSTTVQQSYSGFEQVMERRPEPRRILDYRFRLFKHDAQMFDEAVFGWTGRTFGLPWWPDRTSLTQHAAAGASVLYLDTAGRSFKAGAPAVLFVTSTDYEMLDVREVYADRIVINGTLSRDWSIGARAYPVLPAVPAAEFATARPLPHVLDGSARFTASPTDSAINLPVEPAPATYRGYELYTGETNWRAPLQVTLTARRKDVDGGAGPLSIRRKADFPLVVRGFSWMLRDRAAAWALKAFFARRRGRRYPVWMPSGLADFVPLADIASGQNSMRVRRSEYGRLIGNNEARRDVVLILRNGPPLARRILAVEDEGTDSLVTFTEAFDAPIPVGAIKRVSYLGLYRLASDSVTFAWVTGAVSEVDVNFVLKKDRDS